MASCCRTNRSVSSRSAGNSGFVITYDPWNNLLATNATGLTQPTAFALDGSGNLFITELDGNIRVFTPAGTSNTVATITAMTAVVPDTSPLATGLGLLSTALAVIGIRSMWRSLRRWAFRRAP